MVYNVYSVRDDCAVRFTPPVLFASDAEAIRFFKSAWTGADYGAMTDYPKDFVMLRIGVFDDVVGKLVSQDPEIIARGVDFV